jgi:hypothetical protein
VRKAPQSISTLELVLTPLLVAVDVIVVTPLLVVRVIPVPAAKKLDKYSNLNESRLSG